MGYPNFSAVSTPAFKAEFQDAFPGFGGPLDRRLRRTSGTLINEEDIEEFISEWKSIPWELPSVSGLVLAKITELALFCAGNYADQCEFRAAGDLLVNPRHVDIHLSDRVSPVRKRRHVALSVQLAPQMEADAAPVGWLTENAWPLIRKKALLPTLYEMLAASDLFKDAYLQSVDERMRRISDTIAFLRAWQIENLGDLHFRLCGAPPETGAFIEKHLCLFDLEVFEEINREIFNIFHGLRSYRFLKSDAPVPMTSEFFSGSLCHI